MLMAYESAGSQKRSVAVMASRHEWLASDCSLQQNIKNDQIARKTVGCLESLMGLWDYERAVSNS